MVLLVVTLSLFTLSRQTVNFGYDFQGGIRYFLCMMWSRLKNGQKTHIRFPAVLSMLLEISAKGQSFVYIIAQTPRIFQTEFFYPNEKWVTPALHLEAASVLLT